MITLMKEITNAKVFSDSQIINLSFASCSKLLQIRDSN